MLSQGYQDKIEFVKGLDKAVSNKVGGIIKVEYVIFQHKEHESWINEYLVVKYRGGAIQARNCSMNSNGAILEELAKMAFSSQVYASELDTYQDLLKNKNSNIFY